MGGRTGRTLKTRPDGMVNVTVDVEAIVLLDAYADSLTKIFGFKPSRSQAMRHLLKHIPT